MNKAIIVASFGTSYEKTRKLCIDSIEEKIFSAYPEFIGLKAYTSEMVRGILEKRDGIYIDNLPLALEKIKKEGIKEAYIQPLHIIEGHEYHKLKEQMDNFLDENKDFKLSLSLPLLSDQASMEALVKALDPQTSTVYMGHGSDHVADRSYEELEEVFRKLGYEDVFIATVEGSRSLEDILPKLKKKQYGKLELRPLMLVAGDHAINDMASDGEDSWKSILEDQGFELEIVLEGLGQNSQVAEIFLNKLKEKIQ